VSVEAIQTHLNAISAQNDEQAVSTGLETLLKLIGNILKSPNEDKFRTLKKTNKAIQSRILSLKGGINELILALGYTDLDAEHYAFVGDYFTVLKKGQTLIEKVLEPIRYKAMSPEEQKKYDILQEQKRIYAEEQRKK